MDSSTTTILAQTVTLYGALSIGTGLSLVVATFFECQKYDFTVSLTNGAIVGIFPTVVYFLASFFEFLRSPFTNTFMYFGIQDPLATKIGLSYMVILCLLIMTAWATKDTSKKACVASVDEMSKFKTQLTDKLKKKKDKEAANANAKPKV
jgi:hypothetical protein